MPNFLQANNLHAWYGSSHVLHGVDITIQANQTVGLLGRNGMGKSTLIRTLLGLVPQRQGEITIRGIHSIDLPTHQVARLGVAYVPEGRGVFPNLSVRENLVMAAHAGRDGRKDWDLERVLDTFPRLKERFTNLGGQLSGGEQQMLAMARVLVGNPKLLLIDEPTEGLAPMVVAEIFQLMEKLKKQGISIFLIEQNIHKAIHLCDRHYVVERGSIVLEGNSKDAADRNSLIERVSV